MSNNMEVFEVATRQIMWGIPFPFKVLMYAIMFLSIALFFYGIYKKLQFVSGARGIPGLTGDKGLRATTNWQGLINTLLFTGKVPRSKKVALFHSMIYYGFVVLVIATTLVAIHHDTPFKIFQGPVYIIVSFLADISGIAILIGLTLAYYRRYVLKPEYLKATNPKREMFMYLMILALIILGYALESLRLVGTNMPANEKFYSPVGWALASIIELLHLEENTLINIYRSIWFIHMLNTMAFIATLSSSKFFHLIAAPLNAFITPQRRGAVLTPMNFLDEEAGHFGLLNTQELSAKNRFDLISCVECGRCTQVCPAQNSGKPLDPKMIITKLRDFSEVNAPETSIWDNPVYSANELDSCTTCGACMEECPLHIEHVNIIMEAKRYKVLTLGEIPPAAADAVNKIKNNGNPWGISQEDRFNWANGLDVEVISSEKEVDYLYYVGCAGSYDAANQKVVKDTIGLLKKAGVNFAVMGKTEKCNGDPVRRFGDEYNFYEIAIENIANMRQYKFKKVVTHCPHCLHTIGKEYAKFEDGAFETIHHTELLHDLVKLGKLKPVKEVQETLTFHDPCYLGRHHGQYDAPREILKSIPGIRLKEMEKNKDKSVCCGMGGGNMWYELPEGQHVAINRLGDIAETQSPKVATACSYCLINFNSSKGQNPNTEEIVIDDVASILAKSIG